MTGREPRPDIPEDVKRIVRQRCGFGCVLCGNPIIDYDHMFGYQPERGHVAAELTLLCPEHHRDKTHHRLDLATVLAANAGPFNLRNDASGAKRLEFHGGSCAIWLGDNVSTAQLKDGQAMVAIGVDGIPLVGFGVWQGRLVSMLNLFNEYNELVLQIVENELRYHSLPWDIRFEGNLLTVHEASRKYLLEMELLMPNQIRVRRARILCNGVEIVIQRNGRVVVDNTSLGGNLGIDAGGLVLVGPGWEGASAMKEHRRYNRYRDDSVAARAWQAESRGDGEAGEPLGDAC